MKRQVSVVALAFAIGAPLFLQNRSVAQAPTAAAAKADPNRAMIDRYCVGCHNSRLKTGGLALDNLDLKNAPDDAVVWEKALRKLRGHLMPPPGMPQPPQPAVDQFVGWMETTLDTHPIELAEHMPIANVHLTLLQKVGLERDKWGDSTGYVTEL